MKMEEDLGQKIEESLRDAVTIKMDKDSMAVDEGLDEITTKSEICDA